MDDIKIADLPPEARKVAEIIGLDNYLKLSATYGGFSLYIFCTKSLHKSKRTNRIKQAYSSGLSVNKIMELYGLSRSTVKRLLK